jgi:hypothetical protein
LLLTDSLFSGLRKLHLTDLCRAPHIVSALLLRPLELPASLTSLSVRAASVLRCFRLPPSLQTLYVWGTASNNSLDGLTPLPPQLRALHIMYDITFSLRDLQPQLPASLTELRLPSFSCPIEKWPLPLPPQLHILQCHTISPWNDLQPHLPPSLTEIDTSGHLWPHGHNYRATVPPISLATFQFPPLLQSLTWNNFDGPLLHWKPPPTLQSLCLGRFLRPASELLLPAHLTELDLRSYDHALDALPLPSSITRLTLSAKASPPDALIRLQWPRQLQHLYLTRCYRRRPKVPALQLADWNPPASLTNLMLDGWDVPVNAQTLRLPPSLRRLRFGDHEYAHPVDQLPLPQGLTHLSLSALPHTCGSLREMRLPASLQELVVPHFHGADPAKQLLPSTLPASLLFLYVPSFDPMLLPVLPPRSSVEFGRDKRARMAQAWAALAWPAGLPPGCRVMLGRLPAAMDGWPSMM